MRAGFIIFGRRRALWPSVDPPCMWYTGYLVNHYVWTFPTSRCLCVHCTVSILPPAPLQQRFASSYASAHKGVVLNGSPPFLRLRARVQMQEPHMSHSDTLRPRAVHMLMAHVPQAAGWGAFSRNSHHRCGWTTVAAATVQCSAVELGAAAVDCNEHCELSSRSWSTSTCNDDCNILALSS